MTQEKSLDQVPSADQLRDTLLQAKMKKAQAESARFDARSNELMAFTDKFLREQVTDEEIGRVRSVVDAAVKDGKLEAMVYRFPSALCTDKGRAINSSDKDWPDTLQGKARQFYQRFTDLGRPAGFKLKAMIIDFPNGMPGDVGLFLNWEDDSY
jgi:hypothetical protein